MTTSEGRHLNPATLLEYHQGKLAAEDAEGVRAHVEACAACRAELAMARSFAEIEAGETSVDVKERHRAALLERITVGSLRAAVRGMSEIPAVRARPAWERWLAHALLVASVACLAIAGWQYLHRVPVPEPGMTMRATPLLENRWDMIVWDPTDTAWPLEWPPVVGAAKYLAHVQTASGDMVAEVPASATGIELPFDVVPAERRSEPLYVVAVAVGMDGPIASTRPRFLPRPR